MELNKNQQSLIERARVLQGKISNEINKNNSNVNFCRLCRQDSRFGGIAETPFEEIQSLICIRDSLKDVENKLIFLQNLDLWQQKDRREAQRNLEKSRLFLIEKAKRHPGRVLEVVQELNSCFGNRNNAVAFSWLSKQNGKRRISGFLFCCFINLFKPWKWQSSVRIGLNLVVAAASVLSVIRCCHGKQPLRIKLVKSAKAGKSDDAVVDNSSRHFDAFLGRG